MIDHEVLTRAAISGARAALALVGTATVVGAKGHGDIVTNADLSSQEAVLSVLRTHAPAIPIIAEEQEQHSEILPPSFFTVDPLDGTIVFSRGCPDWGVLVGGVENFTPVAAALVQPLLDRVIRSERGGKTVLSDLNGRTSTVLSLSQGSAERYVIGLDINMFSEARDIIPLIEPILNSSKALLGRTLGAAIAGAFEILLGRGDVYLNPFGGKVWDFAPCALAIEEAGGVALELNLDQRAARPFVADHLRYGVMFARSEGVAEDICRTIGLRYER